MKPPLRAYQFEPAASSGKFDAEGLVKGTVKLPSHITMAEDKADDLRYLLQIAPNGSKKNYLTSRRISKLTGRYVEKQDWCPLMRDQSFAHVPDFANTVIDGGICGEGVSTDVVHQMRQGDVAYRAFDVLMLRGRDVRDLEACKRKDMLEAFVDMCNLPWLTVARTIPRHQIIGQLKIALESGKEGLMLKNDHAPYGKGWYKAKRKETFDVIIVGYSDPDSEIYASKGWIGQLIVGQMTPKGEIVQLGFVKNMTDALRAQISSNKKKFLHTVVEITAQERLKSGKFRNPSVKMPRPDKSPQMCIFQPAIEA